MIEVRLFATLREGREKIVYFEPNKFNFGNELLEYLNIQADEVAIFLINGMHSDINSSFKDKDVIAIFPPVGGG